MSIMRVVVLSIVVLVPSLALGQEPTVLKHDGWVAAVAFAPDGMTLASSGADNVVRLWEVGTWEAKGVLKGHTDCVCALAFSRRNHLATGSHDGTVKIWETKSRDVVRTLTGHKGVVTSVAFQPDDACVLTGGVDGMVNTYMLKSWVRVEFEKPAVVNRHKSWVNSLAFAPRNEKAVYLSLNGPAASGSSDGTVRLFDTALEGKGGMSQLPFQLESGAGEVRSVAFHPDGKLLAAGNRYGTVRIWDVASRKEVKTIAGHMGDVWSIAFSPDGKTLAAVDTDWRKPSKIKLYDTTTWKERGALDTPGEILSIAYSPKGDWLAAGCWDKTVRIFPIAKAADK